ncbi:MAG TPA: TMEM175 family protein, partial [Acidimicrobiales bacterium]|nr:TMEM175 family protein [Acidimicrobiales bacterium]
MTSDEEPEAAGASALEGGASALEGADVLRTHRLEAFSDGVMAVIITIMAFELRAPHGTNLTALRQDLPPLLVYMLSFVFIGIYWNNHHHLLRQTERISGAVMWANLHLLFWLSLMPVLTEWVGTSYRHTEPAAVYGAAALGAAIAYWILVKCIIRANDSDSTVTRSIGSDYKGLISMVIYAAAIPLALVTPWIAYGGY